eukprot:229859-Prorocentrum_minimum.AAC.1
MAGIEIVPTASEFSQGYQICTHAWTTTISPLVASKLPLGAGSASLRQNICGFQGAHCLRILDPGSHRDPEG